jgi:hypothetical protein
MADISVSVRVHGGKRTPVTVSAWLPGNPHSIEFANGKIVTSDKVAKWIEKALLSALQEIQDMDASQ